MCAEKFLAQPDIAVRKAALGKADSWRRGDEFKDAAAKWVTLPGETRTNSALVDKCTTEILKPAPTAAK